MLSLGLLAEENHMKNYPNNTYGCNKCLFRENSSDQMICIRGNTENDTLADSLSDGCIIKIVLDCDNQLFEVIPPKTNKKYVQNLK